MVLSWSNPRPGVRCWRICTSRSLGGAQQATFLVTLAEVVFIWGAFIPSPWLQDVQQKAKGTRSLGKHGLCLKWLPRATVGY